MSDGDELVLRPKEPEPKKPAKPKSDGSTVRVETAFKEAFAARYGFPVICSVGRDRKLLKTLVEQWGETDVLRLVAAFFAATRPGGAGYGEIRRLRWHNIPDFYSGAQMLRRLTGSGPAGDLHPRTAENMHEIAKATGRKP